jgi:hypothetical protein
VKRCHQDDPIETIMSTSSKKIKRNDGKTMSTPFRPPSAAQNAVSNHTASGQKRIAHESPQVSPIKPPDPTIPMDPEFPSLNLEEKLKRVAGKPNLGKEIARAIVEDTQWAGQMWDHDDIQRVLLTDEQPQPFPSYTFGRDKKDKETIKLLTTLNHYKVVKKLQAKYSSLSKPESSAAHPSKGPFVIRKDTKTAGQLIISAIARARKRFVYQQKRFD